MIFANGSLIWASKPAEIRITSGLNLFKGFKILLSNISRYSVPSVPALIGALKILPAPVSSSAPVLGNRGDSCIEP